MNVRYKNTLKSNIINKCRENVETSNKITIKTTIRNNKIESIKIYEKEETKNIDK